MNPSEPGASNTTIESSLECALSPNARKLATGAVEGPDVQMVEMSDRLLYVTLIIKSIRYPSYSVWKEKVEENVPGMWASIPPL
jgi:hypothetical protein